LLIKHPASYKQACYNDAIIDHRKRFEMDKYPMKMNNTISKGVANPLMKVFKTFFSKFVKNNDEYPVKYYKKDKHYPKNRSL
jgi:hypothetical protein